MPLYRCRGLNAGGREVDELFEASDPKELSDDLASRGWSRLRVEPFAAQPSRPLSTEDLITLGEELAGMSRAGLPLDRALAEMSRELRRGRLKHVMEQIVADLRGGKTLGEAIGQRKGALPPLFAAAVTAGVRIGRLPEVLATLNSYARTMADLRTMVAGALYYPLILMLLGLGLFLFVALTVAPTFQVIFDDFRIPMPAITQIALLLCAHPFLYVVAPIAWIVGGVFFFWLITRGTPVGRRLFNRLAYSLPLWGVLLRSVRMASFSELLALLIEYEVPLPEAISLAGRSTTDPGLARACAEVEQELRQGESFSVALDRQRAVPAMFTWMVAVGEPRGMLTGSLRQLGEIYRRRTVLRANLLSSILPPFLVVVVGFGVVGFLVLAFLLPLITLITELA